MKKFICPLLLFIISVCSTAQTTTSSLQRPKLVVGIVIDQMRWDYLYRYYNLYKPDGGFKRFFNNGFTCENTLIPYTPTVTAAGHTCIYTGSVPAIHGMVGNEWYDALKHTVVYCCSDDSASTIGANDVNGRMSPRNMLVTTIGDELKLATNFNSKVIGISMKDRASVLPAGHAADAAYWYDPNNGRFISSSYYMKELPQWLINFNKRKIADSLYKLDWNLSLPEDEYRKYSAADEEDYERKPLGLNQKHFPYKLSPFVDSNYNEILFTPYGNELLLAMAKATISAEQMGRHNATDFLTVSFSSPDYIGHAFGPDSWEQTDDYVRLDVQLGKLFSYLDEYVGRDNYTVFLSADHGVANVPRFSMKHKLPGGFYDPLQLINNLNLKVKEKYAVSNAVITIEEYQLILNHASIDSAKADEAGIIKVITDFLQSQPFVAQAFAIKNVNNALVTAKQKEMFANSIFPNRSGDVQFVLRPGYLEGDGIGTSHGLWNPYDAHIPLLWYGWGIQQGKTNRETYMTDIAPTLAALLHVQMPSGNIGKVITEVMK